MTILKGTPMIKPVLLLLSGALSLTLMGCNPVKQMLPFQEPVASAAIPAMPTATAEVFYRLGLRHSTANPANLYKATEAFETAAKQGHPEAQYLLGQAYLNGKGVFSSSRTAVFWLEQAAVRGHSKAAFALGDLLVNGRGIPSEEAWGVHWFIRAAEQGYGPAQRQAGIAYATGLGVEQDDSLAWVWLKLAQRNQQPDAHTLLQRIEPRLSASALRQAKAVYRRWQPTTYRTAITPVEIRFVQQRLNQLGFAAGAVDGIAGNTTARAITTYAAARNLPESAAQLSPDLITALRAEPQP